VHGKNRRSEGKKDKCLLALALHIVGNPKDKCLLALALHIVGNPILIYKYDVYMLLLHV